MMTFALAPSPKWYFLDATGKPAAGGFLNTFMSLDQTTPKFVFSDPLGQFPYTDPIVLDATGGTPVPIYWDTTSPGLYYIVVTDASGNIILAMNNFPIAGGGGVTPITTINDIQNHLINGQFIFIDADSSAASLISPLPIGGLGVRIAPASGFFSDGMGGYVSTLGSNISGWRFVKSGGAGETSSIQFIDVTPIGMGNPAAPSANATRFFRYTLSVAGSAQTQLQLFQVTPAVETYSGETLTVSFDCRSSTAAIGVFQILQFYGTGGAPSANTSVTQNFNFSVGAWSRISFQVIVPSVVGKNKGTNGDDSVDIVWNLPLNVLGSFDLTNLQIQRGAFGTTPYIYQTFNQDQYKVLIDLMVLGNLLFKTGDYTFSDNNAVRPGWFFIFNDAQTIGSAASGAGGAGSQFQNLYVLWWTVYPQTVCIVTGGRGASAIADFNANKTMTIPQNLVNHVLGIAGNAIPFGLFEGEREHLLVTTEMPIHSHIYAEVTANGGTASGSFSPSIASITSAATATAGGSLPHNNVQPTHYKYLFVKL